MFYGVEVLPQPMNRKRMGKVPKSLPYISFMLDSRKARSNRWRNMFSVHIAPIGKG